MCFLVFVVLCCCSAVLCCVVYCLVLFCCVLLCCVVLLYYCVVMCCIVFCLVLCFLVLCCCSMVLCCILFCLVLCFLVLCCVSLYFVLCCVVLMCFLVLVCVVVVLCCVALYLSCVVVLCFLVLCFCNVVLCCVVFCVVLLFIAVLCFVVVVLCYLAMYFVWCYCVLFSYVVFVCVDQMLKWSDAFGQRDWQRGRECSDISGDVLQSLCKIPDFTVCFRCSERAAKLNCNIQISRRTVTLVFVTFFVKRYYLKQFVFFFFPYTLVCPHRLSFWKKYFEYYSKLLLLFNVGQVEVKLIPSFCTSIIMHKPFNCSQHFNQLFSQHLDKIFFGNLSTENKLSFFTILNDNWCIHSKSIF